MGNGSNMGYVLPSTCDCVLTNEYLYFFDNSIKALCKADLKSHSLDVIESYDKNDFSLSKRILMMNQYFVMQNNYNAELLLFDRDTHKYEFYESVVIGENMYNMLQSGNSVYLVPLHWNGGYLCFDVNLKKFHKCNPKAETIRRGELIFRPFVVNDCILFPAQDNTFLYKLCLENGKTQTIPLPCDTKPYIAIGDDSETWFLEKDARYICRFDKCPIKIDIPKAEYGSIKLLTEHICLMPKGKADIVIISRDDFIVHVIHINDYYSAEDAHMRYSNTTGYVNCVESDEYIYFIPNGFGKMIRVNKTDYSTEECSFWSDEYRKRKRRLLFGDSNVIFENSKDSLKQFLTIV